MLLNLIAFLEIKNRVSSQRIKNFEKDGKNNPIGKWFFKPSNRHI